MLGQALTGKYVATTPLTRVHNRAAADAVKARKASVARARKPPRGHERGRPAEAGSLRQEAGRLGVSLHQVRRARQLKIPMVALASEVTGGATHRSQGGV
ncbi:MAG: hypothetical protein ACRDZX_13260 [Acidimicrobiales bacterium]